MRDHDLLAGKTALITGAAKRIGETIAIALALRGVRLALHYRSSLEEVQGVVSEIRGMGGAASVFQADFSDPTTASRLFQEAREQCGAIDFLINNASIFPDNGLMDFSVDDLTLNMNVNAMAPLILSRRFAEQEREGVIINLLDSRVADYDRKHVPYHISKRSLYSLTKMMAVEFAPNIRVNGVAPGLIIAPEGERPDYLERLKSTNLLHTYGGPEDIADAVVFLLESRFITGQTIFVDGGRHVRGHMYD